jgi:hypothetical protein
LDVGDYIAATACGDDLEHGKPDPRLVGIALRKLGLAGSRTVMVGDTPYDAEAGIEAGTKAADVRPLLLGGVRCLFLNVMFRRAKKRCRADTLKLCPLARRVVFNSSSVMSGLSATSARITSACASIAFER